MALNRLSRQQKLQPAKDARIFIQKILAENYFRLLEVVCLQCIHAVQIAFLLCKQPRVEFRQLRWQN